MASQISRKNTNFLIEVFPFRGLLIVLGSIVSKSLDRYFAVREGEREVEGRSWGRAAHAFFKIVNDQQAKSEYRLYAINGGNDLGGMFLAQSEREAARKSLSRKEDWPYLPTLEHRWYGQYHG